MDKWDACPECKQKAMHDWEPDSKETARACQNCGYVEEKSTSVDTVKEPLLVPARP